MSDAQRGHSRPCLRAGTRARRRPGRRAFTLLEVMVSMAVIAAGMMVLLQAHTMNVERADLARNALVSTLLGQRMLAELFADAPRSITNARGGFADYPGFSWRTDVYATDFSNVRQVVLTIAWPAGRTEKNMTFEVFLAGS